MKMLFASIAIGLAFGTSPALAYENYIPLGTGYSSNVDRLPAFDSDAGQISQQTDIYETELYMKNRKRAEDESRLREFFSDRNSTGSDSHIDY